MIINYFKVIMKISVFFLFLSPFSIYAQTDETSSLTPNGKSNDLKRIQISEIDSVNSEGSNISNESHFSPRTYLNLLFDPKLTMRSGAETVISIHNGVSWAKDKLIGIRWFSEDGFWGKTGGIMGRLTKWILIDLPLDYFPVHFTHEYFGHGSRYREMDFDIVDYNFGIPPPYGGGSGSANGRKISRMQSDHEMLALYSGGLEVQSVMNQRLKLRSIVSRKIQYWEAFLYFNAFVGTYSYFHDTHNDLEANKSGWDVAEYLRRINHHAGFSDSDNLQMDVKGLKSRNMISLADPFFWYTVRCFKTYLVDGSDYHNIPMIQIRGIDYLPSLRLGLTPFGPEYHLENFLLINNKAFLINLRIGDQAFHKSWGGLGLSIQNIYENKRLSLDMNLDIWKQPEIEIGGDSITSKGGGVGTAFSFRGHYDFTGSKDSIAAVVELGYKSPGFLEGYVLDSSLVFMFGMGFRN